MMLYVDQRNVDLVTNVQKRTFPHGHSSEMICARTFSKIDPTRLSDDEREHVTKFYYSHPTEFKILNLENKDATYGDLNFTVDTIEDLRRLEEFLRRGVVQQHPNIIVPDALS
jgi:spore coat polysaccharide biosynthesis protein SpsF (cytidylyltransferase family)